MSGGYVLIVNLQLFDQYPLIQARNQHSRINVSTDSTGQSVAPSTCCLGLNHRNLSITELSPRMSPRRTKWQVITGADKIENHPPRRAPGDLAVVGGPSTEVLAALQVLWRQWDAIRCC